MFRDNKGLKGRKWAAFRLQILERDDYQCACCGSAANLEVDHIKPRHRRGEVYSAENCRVLCATCHIKRHKRKLSPAEMEWAKLISEQI